MDGQQRSGGGPGGALRRPLNAEHIELQKLQPVIGSLLSIHPHLFILFFHLTSPLLIIIIIPFFLFSFFHSSVCTSTAKSNTNTPLRCLPKDQVELFKAKTFLFHNALLPTPFFNRTSPHCLPSSYLLPVMLSRFHFFLFFPFHFLSLACHFCLTFFTLHTIHTAQLFNFM